MKVLRTTVEEDGKILFFISTDIKYDSTLVEDFNKHQKRVENFVENFKELLIELKKISKNKIHLKFILLKRFRNSV
jgi:hypothetical protein